MRATPLFMYLWDRRFSTAEYSAGPFVRFFDRRVAKLVGYDKARASYAMLNAIPTRLREHAAGLREELQGARARLTAIEREALEKSGAQPLEARVRERNAAFDAADRSAPSSTRSSRRAATASPRERRPTSKRSNCSRRPTPPRISDRCIAKRRRRRTPPTRPSSKRIESTENAIGRAEKETGAIRREMQELARRRKQIESERDEFRRRGYDDPFGSFGNERVLASVLGGILGGVIQSTVLRDVLKEGYHRQPGPWDSDFGGGASLPGGGGGDGFNTGGSMGGRDGFRTGGSF